MPVEGRSGGSDIGAGRAKLLKTCPGICPVTGRVPPGGVARRERAARDPRLRTGRTVLARTQRNVSSDFKQRSIIIPARRRSVQKLLRKKNEKRHFLIYDQIDRTIEARTSAGRRRNCRSTVIFATLFSVSRYGSRPRQVPPFNLAPAVGSLYIAAWKQGLDPCQ